MNYYGVELNSGVIMEPQPYQLPPLEIPPGTLLGVANALRHWHEHRPRMYTELHEKGTLLDMAVAAYEATVDDESEIQYDLEEKGYDTYTAVVMSQQAVRERYIYLPTEEDCPELMQSESGLYAFEPEPDG